MVAKGLSLIVIHNFKWRVTQRIDEVAQFYIKLATSLWFS